MIKVIFDNGGGTTLLINKEYAHNYDEPTHAASAYMEYMETETTCWWDGNVPELIIEDEDKDYRCCLVLYEDDVEDAVISYINDPDNYSSYGANESEFLEYLANYRLS